jgi:hypothetical protein
VNPPRNECRKTGLWLAILILAGVTGAQTLVSVKSGVVQFIYGDVFLEGKRLQFPADRNILMDNEQLLNTKNGMAEVLLSPAAYLRLGKDSSVRLQNNELDRTQLDLEKGSVLIEVVTEIEGNRTLIRIAGSNVEIDQSGLYRLDADPGELRVYRGEAVVGKQGKTSVVKSGGIIYLNRLMRQEKFDVNSSDSLHQWAARRSFDLFIITAGAGSQTHWVPTSMGWVRNSAYRVSFYSEIFRLQWIKDQASRQIEELLAKYKLEQEANQRTIYGAEYEQLLAKIREAQQAIDEAHRKAKETGVALTESDPGR